MVRKTTTREKKKQRARFRENKRNEKERTEHAYIGIPLCYLCVRADGEENNNKRKKEAKCVGTGSECSRMAKMASVRFGEKKRKRQNKECTELIFLNKKRKKSRGKVFTCESTDGEEKNNKRRKKQREKERPKNA
jgi:hypothetical protein